MIEAAKKLLVTLMVLTLVGLGTLSALGAEGDPAEAGVDTTTDGTTVTTVTPTDPQGDVVVGEIRTSSISSTRSTPETAVVYYFVYSGPGAVDFQFDSLNGCLVSLTSEVNATPTRCAR